jgi:hypothetical protein
MTMHLGNVDASSTLYIPFASYGSDGQSITLSGLAVTDIEIYKNGSTTQRSSDAGYTLLDTDGIDFDGITGIHGFSIDLSDNTDSGFYAAGSFYWVVVSAVTIDSQTVNFIAATFRIGPQAVNVTQFGGTNGTFSSGRPEVNTTHAAGTAWASGAITASALASDAITAAKVASDVGVEFADALLDRNMATGTDSGGRTVRNALRPLRNKISSSAGTLTVTKEDDTTSAWTASLTTDAAAVPIIGVDPA